jgi:hypothetical protein
MAADLGQHPPTGLDPLVDALKTQLGEALCAIVLYGSTRRNDDVRDGLVDLMAVVTDYRSAHARRLPTLLNRMLPPNVYYLEAGGESARVRCKWILVSRRTLNRRMRGGLDGYFWARFTQPCRCVWAVDDSARAELAALRAAAATHFARRAVGIGPARLTAAGFWRRAIAATYACELRPEPPEAAERLVARDPAFWETLSDELLPRIGEVERDDEFAYRLQPNRVRRIGAWIEWRARRVWSKSLNLARLLKATGTFANGVDYLCWKIERHSGVRIEPTERMRRHPRRTAAGLMWKMWRSGALK